MAKPQAENGHIDIANEIAERLAKTQLSGYEQRVLWAIWRKTWGWHKKEDPISLSQFTELTLIPSSHIARTINKLIDRNIIYKKNGRISIYGFQKDYEKWSITNLGTAKKGTAKNGKLPKKALPKLVTNTTKIGKKLLPKLVDTKENKRNYTKEKAPVFLSTSNLLKTLILQNNPKAKITDSQIKNWGNTIRLMIERDKRTVEEIESLIKFSQNDNFWKSNILSMDKLRKQFDRLTLQAKQKEPKNEPEVIQKSEPMPQLTPEQIADNKKRLGKLIDSLN